MTRRSVLEKFSAVWVIDVRAPTSDGRELALTRHTQPGSDLKRLIKRLKQTVPPQPSPKITATPGPPPSPRCSAGLQGAIGRAPLRYAANPRSQTRTATSISGSHSNATR